MGQEIQSIAWGELIAMPLIAKGVYSFSAHMSVHCIESIGSIQSNEWHNSKRMML